jgi:CHAD domain-containing protein
LAYSFQPQAGVPQEIKRIAVEELEGAIGSLCGRRMSRDLAIHDARKHVKKLRALLRLVRDEFGEAFTPLNTRLRDAGRALSQFRDAIATLETFDSVKDKFAHDVGGRNLAFVRQGLILHKARTEERARIEKVMREVPAELLAVRQDVDRWPLVSDGFSAIAAGLKAVYRRGRKAMELARTDPRPENFHEWRKRVKDRWYHARLLHGLRKDELDEDKDSLKKLEDRLGMEHNLAVLRTTVEAEPGLYGTTVDITILFELLERYQKELREESLSLGEEIYQEKPRQLIARLGRIWPA